MDKDTGILTQNFEYQTQLSYGSEIPIPIPTNSIPPAYFEIP